MIPHNRWTASRRISPALLCGALSAAMALTGCHGLPGQNPMDRGPGSELRSAPRLTLNWPIDESSAPPRPADIGVVVCEPIPNGADASQAAFGAGCARWLQMAVGGQGDLAQTPTWTTIERARKEMRLNDLRLALDDTAQMAQKTGASHCVVGEIRGSEKDGALMVAIAEVAAKKLIGKPVTIQGSRAEILQQLPALARQVASRLGVANPFLPATVECAPDDMAFLGSVPWQPDRSLPAADKARLAALGRKSPVAALLALASSDLRDKALCESLAHDLVTAAPGNTAAFGGLAYIYWHGCETEGRALDALRARYPGNYQLAAAQIMRVRGGFPAGEQDAAAALVRAAPRNPDAWLSAGYSISSAGDRLRKGRFSAQLSPAESAMLDRNYAEWLTDVRKAVELDPDYAHAWARLATAATFAGDYALADRALWTALRLNPEEEDALSWGLQMYQPKWGGDPAKLLDVAHRAAEAWHWDSRVYGAARELEAGGQPVEARHLRVEALRRQRIAAAAAPTSFDAQAQYAWGLKESTRYAQAETALRNLIKQFPRESALAGGYHDPLGTCLMEQGKNREAIAEFLAASRIYPQNAAILRNLGYAYRQNVEPQKAIEVFRRADRTDGGNGNSWGLLGDALLDARKMQEAVVAYQKAVDLDPRQAICWRNLSKALGQCGRYQEGIDAARKSVSLDDTDYETYDSLAFLYGQTKQPDKCAEECRKVLQLRPNDALAHSNLGEALNDMHQRAEARREWETAARLDPKGTAGKNARAMLAKNP